MRVFNITDASTAALRNQHLENQHIRVGESVIPPGGWADIKGTAKERSELYTLVKAGAVTLDELPVTYAAKRGLNLDGSPQAVMNMPVEKKMVGTEPAPAEAPAEELPKKGKK